MRTAYVKILKSVEWCNCFFSSLLLPLIVCMVVLLGACNGAVGIHPRVFGCLCKRAVMLDGLHDIRSSPVMAGQSVPQDERPISGAPHSFTKCRAAELQTDLMKDFAQVSLCLIYALHLCNG